MDPLIRNSENWHDHVYAIPGCDQIMSAFVQLRILGSGILDLFWVDSASTSSCSSSTAAAAAAAAPSQTNIKDEGILEMLNCELDRWENKWYDVVENGKLLSLHSWSCPYVCICTCTRTRTCTFLKMGFLKNIRYTTAAS